MHRNNAELRAVAWRAQGDAGTRARVHSGRSQRRMARPVPLPKRSEIEWVTVDCYGT